MMEYKVKPEEDKIREERHYAKDLFGPIIFLLKCVGNCPLSKIYKEELISLEGEDGIPASTETRFRYQAYTVNYRSPLTLLCFIHGTMNLTVWVTLLCEMVSGVNILGSHIFDLNLILTNFSRNMSLQNERGSLGQTIRILFCFVPIIQLLEIIFSWLESKDFGNFLNNFYQLQRDYFSTFPFAKQFPQPNMNKIRNAFLVFYVFVPTAIGVPMVLYLDLLFEFSILGIYVTVVFGIQLTFVSLLEDVKVILSYLAIGKAFRQIRLGMIYDIKRVKLTAQKVKSWRNLVHGIRGQAVLAGNWQKYHQLMLLLGSILLATVTAFVSLNGSTDTANFRFFIFVGVSYVLLIVGRIYIKIYAAHSISFEESIIAAELISLNVPEDEIALYLEVKFLHDMIQQKPCFINLGSYATLNKQLILLMTSQVVTYLVVMMQFIRS